MIALDTNILIYACDKSDARRQQVALDLVSGTADGVLLWQVACEFVAASRKLSGGPDVRHIACVRCSMYSLGGIFYASCSWLVVQLAQPRRIHGQLTSHLDLSVGFRSSWPFNSPRPRVAVSAERRRHR